MNSNLIQFLVTLGLSQEEAETQLRDLGQLIAENVVIKLAKASGKTAIDETELTQLVEASKNDESLRRTIEEESTRLTGDYLDALTQGLSEDKKQAIAQQLASALIGPQA